MKKIFPFRYYHCILLCLVWLVVTFVYNFILISFDDNGVCLQYLPERTIYSIFGFLFLIHFIFYVLFNRNKRDIFNLNKIKVKSHYLNSIFVLLFYSTGRFLFSQGLFNRNGFDVFDMPLYMIFSICLFAPIAEEFVFRGVYLNGLNSNKKYPITLNIILVSIFFMFFHVGSTDLGKNIILFINSFLLSVYFSYLFSYYKDLLLVIILHSIANILSLFFDQYTQLISFDSPVLNIVFAIFSFIISIYLLISQIKKISCLDEVNTNIMVTK